MMMLNKNKNGVRYFCSCGFFYRSKKWKDKHKVKHPTHVMMIVQIEMQFEL